MRHLTSLAKLLSLIVLLVGTPVLANAQDDTTNEDKQQLRARALIKAKTITTLSSQIDARVLTIPFESGDKFKEGDALVVLDCTFYKLAFERAKANLEYSRQNLKNKQELVRLKSAGSLEAMLAQAEETMALADVNMAELPVKNCQIPAPFSGRVGKRLVSVYQFVGAGEELIEVVDTETFEIRLIVPSTWLSWLKTGTVFSVAIDELNISEQAKITRISSQVEAVSQTISIIGVFNKTPEQAISGMSGEAIFER